MKTIVIIYLLTIVAPTVLSQNRIFTKNGVISFSAGTAVEDIDGVNRSVTSIIDTETGRTEFALLMKGFEFKRSLMQEHFNENYIESSKFPKATFKGDIQDISSVHFSENGKYIVTVKGKLEIHGVVRDIETSGTIYVKDGVTSCESSFIITLADYNIAIPKAVADKLSPTVTVNVSCNYKPL